MPLSNQHIPLFIDTDIGIDDAVAIAWLLKREDAHILGFTTVVGNTTVEHATANLLTLLSVADRTNLPVTIGAAAPLVFPATRTGVFIHGPDGLWFHQAPQAIRDLPTDAPAALAAAARSHPNLAIIALGPLTNIAQAVQRFPEDLAGVRLIALGGAQKGGNRTPVAEFNIFADPHALEIVLASAMNVELITLDTFEQVQVHTSTFPKRLAEQGGVTGQFLAGILPPYFQATASEIEAHHAAGFLPDVIAAIYVLRPDLATSTPALVKVITTDTVTRGQTIIGTDTRTQVLMIADDVELSTLVDEVFTPDFDLPAALWQIAAREPTNAHVILNVDGSSMAQLLEHTLTTRT